MLLDKVQAVADNMWKEHRNTIAGTKGAKACRHLSALNSQPEFPIVATALATMPALGSGISVMLWGEEEPLSMTLFNVNYSQTRKSRLGKLSEKMNRAVDAHIRAVLEPVQHQTESDPRQGEGEAESGIHDHNHRRPERSCVGRFAG